jgi:hypothetical protein
MEFSSAVYAGLQHNPLCKTSLSSLRNQSSLPNGFLRIFYLHQPNAKETRQANTNSAYHDRVQGDIGDHLLPP